MTKVPPEAIALYAGSAARDEPGVTGAALALQIWEAADELRRTEARARVRALDSLGVRLIADFALEYPAGLRELSRPPRALVVRGGELPAREHAIALVGSRAASPYGLTHARRLASDLVRLGFAVVSGFARGIDAAAHRGALEAGGVTIAIVPGTIDRPTPAGHPDLESAIAAHGAFASEHVWPIALQRRSFVERNRLIAALTAATVVVEADERSGALHTARAARRLGRPVLAVPGDLDRPTARGCHALVRAGAELCTCAADVVLAASTARPQAAAGRPARGRGATASRSGVGDPPSPEARVLAALGSSPRTAEAVARAAELPLADTLAALLALEWSGGARSLPGSRWARRGERRS